MSRAAVLTRGLSFSRQWSDLIIALAIFVFAAFGGARFVESDAVKPQFYQGRFAPAVMEACGRGFVMPRKTADIPGLQDFLQLKQSSFDCGRIPQQFEQASTDKFQEVQRYLFGAVALNWRLMGVSWNALYPLYSLLFGLSGLAAYGCFRLGMGKALALVLSLLFVLSPLQLGNLPHLRDYAKAPFIIGLVFLLGYLVKHKTNRGRMFFVSLLVGCVLGLGVGFRMDLLIFVPAVIATLMLFAGTMHSNVMGVRTIATLFFIAAFLLTGWPILQCLGSGGNTFHVILLGLMSPFDAYLGIRPSSVYEWGYMYKDMYVYQFFSDFAHRVLDVNTPISLATSAYEHVGMHYYFEIVTNFPADIATRFAAATLKILQSVAPVRYEFFNNVAPYLVLTGLAIVASRSVRIGIFCVIAILYLCGYPSLQFGGRHWFHLQFVPMFFIGVLGQVVLDMKLLLPGRSSGAISKFREGAIANAVRGMTVVAASLAIGWLSLLLLQAYQQEHLGQMLKRYEQQSTSSGQFSTIHMKDDVVRLVPFSDDVGRPPGSQTTKGKYWILELDSKECGIESVPISIKYEPSNPAFNFSRNMTLENQVSVRYMFHTFSSPFSYFVGVDIPQAALKCVKAFGEAVAYEQLPLLLNLTFREGWANEPLYQRIGEGKSNIKPVVGAQSYILPASFSISEYQAEQLRSQVDGVDKNILAKNETVKIENGNLVVNGNAPTSYAYAIRFPVVDVSGAQVLVAEGELLKGGLTLGLINNNRWADQVNVMAPGKFKILIKPTAGMYTLVLAHNVPDDKFNHFRITKLGWTSPGALR